MDTHNMSVNNHLGEWISEYPHYYAWITHPNRINFFKSNPVPRQLDYRTDIKWQMIVKSLQE